MASLSTQFSEQKDLNGKLDQKCIFLEKEVRRLENERADFTRKISAFEQQEPIRRHEHDKRMAQAAAMEQSFERQKNELIAKEEEESRQRLTQMKAQWKTHEEGVKNFIKNLCDRNIIEYINEWPGKGKPDNAIKICDELIVFDAKSPATDDLSNFNTYLKTQTESVSKYLTHDTVRKDIYLVIPTNTFQAVKKFVYNLGGYTVYIVTLDALEPIILSLKRIEEYEFAEQLKPEDRQNICRVIGGLLNASKRRIQVDHFFNAKMLELIGLAERELPETIFQEVNQVDKALMLNPPVDKRAKVIQADELRKRQSLLEGHLPQVRIEKAVSIEIES